ncbi:MAG TPA: glycosyltransferase [Pyrinomonadaceae bacterium]|jgi:polysaccharide deacetylase family protein (PEP-CTERM system associated)|nr:glycosyltransferase [Pyrinomonadaceae bacterium]
MSAKVQSGRHLLTVLVEDYFHVGAFENLIQQRNWSNFEPRYEQNTRKTLDLLDRYDTKATFFVLGWIAEQNPGLIREIAGRGHEVASRGFYHRSLKNLTNEEFREDLRRTSRAIESACGQKVIGYRAAEKLQFGKDDWVLDVLAEEGFAYDASFMPDRRTDKQRRVAHQFHTGGRAIWEFPYATLDLGLGLLPISGGNYIRQFPYTLMRSAVRGWSEREEQPFPFYFHVWELDPEQPRISAASKINRVRHYRKLDKMEWILNENLALYDCVGIADHLGLKEQREVNARAVDTVKPVKAKVKSKDQTPVTVVIPCYNEQEALPYLANTLRSVESELAGGGYQANFVFVDDKSKDGTFALLNDLFGKLKNVRIIGHEVNKGVAAGVMTGINAAKTDIVCSMDCDCTYDPHELLRMLPLLAEGVDLVTASPYHKDGGVRNVPGWRLFLSRGASFLYRRVLRSKLDTYTSCFRVYRRSAFADMDLMESGFLGIAEMLGRLDLEGGKIVEFPAVLEVRLFGISKMKTAKTIGGHLKLLTRLAKIRLFRKSEPIKTSLPTEKLNVS